MTDEWKLDIYFIGKGEKNIKCINKDTMIEVIRQVAVEYGQRDIEQTIISINCICNGRLVFFIHSKCIGDSSNNGYPIDGLLKNIVTKGIQYVDLYFPLRTITISR